MTAGRWFEVGIGFVLPTAALVWILWKLWRWYSPGGIRRPERFLTGVAEFLLVCVFVILIILAWELFRTWRKPQHSAEPRVSATDLLQIGHERHGPAV